MRRAQGNMPARLYGNRQKVKIRRRFTENDARKKMKRLYPVIQN